jgi:hypothetical protein
VVHGGRSDGRPKVGLVLGAGGVVGQAYQVGVLAALEGEAGWDPRQADMIVGTSAGSVTGVALRVGVPATDLAAWTSTTQVCGGSVVGAGLGRRQPVRWSIFRRMAFTWFVTLPAAALVGAGAFYGQNAIGGSAGVVVLFIVLAVFCAAIFALSRKNAVSPDNVNDAWSDSKPSTPAVAVAA